eukprot:9123521-Ditylum_brightwellii.AAC.1
MQKRCSEGNPGHSPHVGELYQGSHQLGSIEHIVELNREQASCQALSVWAINWLPPFVVPKLLLFSSSQIKFGPSSLATIDRIMRCREVPVPRGHRLISDGFTIGQILCRR